MTVDVYLSPALERLVQKGLPVPFIPTEFEDEPEGDAKH